eukprot:Gb_00429 [translate_table: standard]
MTRLRSFHFGVGFGKGSIYLMLKLALDLWVQVTCWLRVPLQTEEKKQAAADVLFQYSQFVMACIGEGVRPSQLRIHLMKFNVPRPCICNALDLDLACVAIFYLGIVCEVSSHPCLLEQYTSNNVVVASIISKHHELITNNELTILLNITKFHDLKHFHDKRPVGLIRCFQY